MNRLTTSFVLATLTVIAAAAPAQQLRTAVIYTNGSAMSTDPDKSQALSDATENAQNQANSTCMGSVTNVETTFSSCTPLGSEDEGTRQYMCSVNVKARCEIEYRPR